MCHGDSLAFRGESNSLSSPETFAGRPAAAESQRIISHPAGELLGSYGATQRSLQRVDGQR